MRLCGNALPRSKIWQVLSCFFTTLATRWRRTGAGEHGGIIWQHISGQKVGKKQLLCPASTILPANINELHIWPHGFMFAVVCTLAVT
jgi:hypothetical protein